MKPTLKGASRKSLPLAIVSRLSELSKEIRNEQVSLLAHLSNSIAGLIESAKSMAIVGNKLTEAKRLLGHGYFIAWLDEPLQQIPRRTASRYMAFAREWGKLGPALERITKSAKNGPFEQMEIVRDAIRSAMIGAITDKGAEPEQPYAGLMRRAESFIGCFDDVDCGHIPDDVREKLRAIKARLEAMGI